MTMTIVLVLFSVVLPAALLLALPKMLAPSAPFGVFIPAEHLQHPQLRQVRRRYYGSVSLAGLVALAVLAAWRTELALVLVSLLEMVALLACFFVAHRSVRALKRANSWQQPAAQPQAVIFTGSAPRPLSNWWLLGYVLVLALSIGLAVWVYPHLPDQVILQTDLRGEVTNTAEKSWRVVVIWPLTVAFVALLGAAIHWLLANVKPTILDRERPAASLLAQTVYYRNMTAALHVMMLLCCLGMAIIPLELARLLSEQLLLVLIFGGIGIGIALLVINQLVAGDLGLKYLGAGNALPGSSNRDEQFWRGGMIYVNRDDPALVVPKLFGIGCTLNFGHPAAKWWTGGFVLLTAAFIAATVLLAG